MHPATEAVVQALKAAGSGAEVRQLDAEARTAVQAAQQLGVPVGAIANSLIFDAAGVPVLVLASGAHRVDTAVAARAFGVAKLQRADPDFVKQHTGQVIGGVAPVGHPAPLATLVDTALAEHQEIWAAAGHSHAVFRTSYQELLDLTGGTAAAVAG